ncbi:hypothetical protein L0Y81_30530 (plasmid) [Burkholderia multivorans]|uniref:hypothetical protein n=1 Tax=Burkholderia multivorans TaxID=87883 RepID=UPI0011B22D5C|nr:hypothetical protein [Burkholderia multivorans]ELK7722776.1 hypothetical protein [Burkholderia cenocepacia]MBR8048086.1 hypothetical protein [Burkholderia multivorans]MBR8453219.1 hypothetical protein [Burkholderia multivorans]MBU9450150.1 hypothetical protein [Burkholderia multivorans]MBU9528766.1 hypothetical protein [Burkholderia multivorans]
MAATRWTNGNTTQNAQGLIDAINDPNIVTVTLFASPTSKDPSFSDSDGPDTNLPLLSALTHSNSGNTTVFDGVFLTAARQSRYFEVRDVLDAAIASGKVYFGASRAPFTSALTPLDATRSLSAVAPVEKLTSSSRPRFFRLLSGVTEATLAAL